MYLCRFFFLLGPNYIMGTHNMYIIFLHHKYFQQLVSFAGGLVVNALHCELKDPRLQPHLQHVDCMDTRLVAFTKNDITACLFRTHLAVSNKQVSF